MTLFGRVRSPFLAILLLAPWPAFPATAQDAPSKPVVSGPADLSWFEGNWLVAYPDSGLGQVSGHARVMPGHSQGLGNASQQVVVDLVNPRTGGTHRLQSYRITYDGKQVNIRFEGKSPPSGLLAEGDFSYASGEAGARALLAGPNPPSAIIASNDQMSLATLEVARELGLDVPRDLSIVSFDNTPIVHFSQPPLTAVDQPVAATVARAVELIIAAQRGEKQPDGPTVVSGSLVERGSTAPHGG